MSTRFPRAVAIIGAVFFIAVGIWAMVDPHSFFEAAAKFEPYNQHFLQDVGAFQIGLGAALHAVSHAIGQDLGGTPAQDIPLFGAIAAMRG